MTISVLDIVLNRVSSASIDSPLAVFDAGEGFYDVIYGATIEGQRRIKEDKRYLGSFTQTMTREEVIRDLVLARNASFFEFKEVSK